MKIVAIDPGKTTGWAEFDTDTPEIIRCGEIGELVNLRTFLLRWFTVSSKDEVRVVIEDFTISQRTIKTALDYTALRIIGWAVIEGEFWDVPPVLQLPMRKTFASDDILKQVGWYRPSKGGHQNDALRHLLYYLLMNHQLVIKKLMFPNEK